VLTPVAPLIGETRIGGAGVTQASAKFARNKANVRKIPRPILVTLFIISPPFFKNLLSGI
jgi:hypothetical protein